MYGLLLAIVCLSISTVGVQATATSNSLRDEMTATLRSHTAARMAHRARFDLGEHGTLFNRFAGLSQFKAADGYTYNGAELVGFFGDFLTDCSLQRVICLNDDASIDAAAKEFVNIGYKLDSKNPAAARWLSNLKRLRQDEFDIAYGNRANGTGDFPATVNGGLTPGRSNAFWAAPWMQFWFKWVKDPVIQTRGQAGHFCNQMQALNANSDHFSTCARRSGKVLLKLGLAHLAANRGKSSEHWAYFALFAALHMLTDQFAPGHVRVPAVALREKCYTPGEQLTDIQLVGGMSVNAMHDLDNIQGIHLTRPLGPNLQGTVPQRTSLGGKTVHTLWKGFGDHRYYTAENGVNKQAVEEFLRLLSDITQQYRTGSKSASAVDADVSTVMKLVPRWRWSALTVQRDSCPFYFVNCAAGNKGKTTIEVDDGEELEPDCNLKVSEMSDMWRLRHPTETNLPSELKRTVKIKGTSVKCDYVTFLTPLQKLNPLYSLYSSCFTAPLYAVACSSTQSQPVFSSSTITGATNNHIGANAPDYLRQPLPSVSALQPLQNWMQKKQLRTTLNSKCYLTYTPTEVAGQPMGADWSVGAIAAADPILKLTTVPGGAPESDSDFRPVTLPIICPRQNFAQYEAK